MDFLSDDDMSLNRSSDDGDEESENVDKLHYFNATKMGEAKIYHLKVHQTLNTKYEMNR